MKCLLPGCEIEGQSHYSGFCSHDHRKAGYVIARQRGLKSLRLEATRQIPLIASARFDEGKARTHCELVLELLKEHAGEWIDHPYQRLRVMWHSRTADLRKRGYRIYHRVVIENGAQDHQYMLESQ